MTPNPLLDLLDQRRSTPCLSLRGPGPDAAELERIVATALRVPDHGRLAPWRLLNIDAGQRARVADWLVQRHARIEPGIAAASLDKDRQRFGGSPCWLLVVASIEDTRRIPESEQLLSAGCVCFSLLLAAEALGFGAQWLTGWAAYDRGVAEYFGLAAHERIVGFVHIGRRDAPVPERERPRLADKLQAFRAP